MKLSRWLLLGGAFYLLFALVRLPASVVVNWLAPEGTSVSGVTGSAWNGQASSVQTPAFALSDVRWSLKPWKLLVLKASADINAKVPGGAIRTEVNSSLFGNSGTANELRGVVKLEPLTQLLKLRLPLTGNAGLTFNELGWTDDTLTSADGEIQLADVSEPTSATRLGNFTVVFTTREGGVTGTFSDTEAIFNLDGKVDVNTDRTFAVDASIEPTSDTPSTIGTAVGMMGARQDGSGNYVLSSQGSY